MAKRKPVAQMQRIVEQFNAEFPIGTRVMLRKDNGFWIETRVRASALLLSGHSPVAWFDGVSGAYSIEDGRVRKVPK